MYHISGLDEYQIIGLFEKWAFVAPSSILFVMLRKPRMNCLYKRKESAARHPTFRKARNVGHPNYLGRAR